MPSIRQILPGNWGQSYKTCTSMEQEAWGGGGAAHSGPEMNFYCNAVDAIVRVAECPLPPHIVESQRSTHIETYLSYFFNS